MTLTHPRPRKKERALGESLGDHIPAKLDPVGHEEPQAPVERVFTRAVLMLLAGTAIYRLLLAVFATNFVLVDDAYIHLRYARNLIDHGYFAYNAGEAVFGLTSPLYGLVTAGLYGVFGGQVEVAVIVLNTLIWTLTGALLAKELPPGPRLGLLGLFLLAPVFVDNQMLGMETPLFVFLLVGAAQAARNGKVLQSALWFGPALITRPEAVLLVPFLLYGVARAHGPQGALKRLTHPKALLALLGPGIAWATFAIMTYGSIIPQSMLAKTGWNSTHYDGFVSFKNAVFTVPRLSFLPFLDYFPVALQWGMSLGLIGAIGWVVRCNILRGSAASRAWLGFYLVYLGFYIAGKGATEASWYAVPSSVALLCASAPAIPGWFSLAEKRWPQWAIIGLLLLASTAASIKRGPLLKSYVEGYGESADFLESYGDPIARPSNKVVIGEIGVFGFRSSHPVVDVGALVSPEVLPWKNAGHSFTRIVQEANAGFFVISNRALELNMYPSVGTVWADDAEREWFDTHCRSIAKHLDKHTYEVLSAPIAQAGQ
jgi:hypothetical protein